MFENASHIYAGARSSEPTGGQRARLPNLFLTSSKWLSIFNPKTQSPFHIVSVRLDDEQQLLCPEQKFQVFNSKTVTLNILSQILDQGES